MRVKDPSLILADDDARTIAAQEAERRLFSHYHLDYTVDYINLPGSNLRVRILHIGSGKPVVMVPGGVGDAWIFATLCAQLAGYHLIVVNRPGGGMSDGIDHRTIDMAQFAAETLTAVLDHYAVARAPVICNSMGGRWGFWFAQEQEARVSAIIQLGAPALILDTSAPFPMRLFSVPSVNRFLVKKMIPASLDKARELPALLGHPKQVGLNWPDPEAECHYYFSRLPTLAVSWLSLLESVLNLGGAKQGMNLGEDDLGRVRQPVAFIWGKNDPFAGLEVAHRAQKLVPDAELYEVGSGHHPWWDAPDECGRLCRDFLARKA